MDDVFNERGVSVRSVTAEETAHYHQYGWVKLENFINPSKVAELLTLAKELMGEHGCKNATAKSFSYFIPQMANGIHHPILRPLIDEIGRNARLLSQRKADVGVRYFTDFFAPKLPSKQDSEFGGNGPSGFHQDFSAAACDRSGGMVFWIPLMALTPKFGTMSFVNGSHRYGVMGHQFTYGDGDIFDSYPELLDNCTMSEAMSYNLGDVTVHSNLTVHGSAANIMDSPRWAYLVIVNPADACWTGGVADAFDTAGLTLHKPLDDERFPVIA
jgi:hypothetical protein